MCTYRLIYTLRYTRTIQTNIASFIGSADTAAHHDAVAGMSETTRTLFFLPSHMYSGLFGGLVDCTAAAASYLPAVFVLLSNILPHSCVVMYTYLNVTGKVLPVTTRTASLVRSVCG